MRLLRFKTALVGLILIVNTSPQSFAAKVGDIASGTVSSENTTALVLKTDPCSADSPTLSFSYPWKKRSLGKKKCANNNSYELFEIEQLPAKKPPSDDNATNDKNNSAGNSGKSTKDTPEPPKNDAAQTPPNEVNPR